MRLNPWEWKICCRELARSRAARRYPCPNARIFQAQHGHLKGVDPFRHCCATQRSIRRELKVLACHGMGGR